MNGDFKCIFWAFGTRCHRLAGYGIPSISLSQPIIRASEHIRHAVAIDERRAFFRQNLFRPAPGQDVLELWFPGVHSDIGGGVHPKRRSTLVELVHMDARASGECWPIFRCGKIERAGCREACASLG